MTTAGGTRTAALAEGRASPPQAEKES